MSGASEAGTFLSTRRSRITPEQAGVRLWGGQRRVSGLRREEVAQLAGVSADYYARLERGDLHGVSEAVLESIARALQLDDAERGHLHDLAAAANTRPRTRTVPRAAAVRPGLLRTLEAMSDAPAFVTDRRRDIVAANPLGRALYSQLYAEPLRPVNTARFAFLSAAARRFFVDWSGTADDTVANLRTDAGANPFDEDLADLIDEPVARSGEFRRRWAAHDVRHHRTGTKGIRHPVVGELRLGFEVMRLPADEGLSMVVYTAEPGSRDADGLTMLAGWAADRPEVDAGHAATARPPGTA